jgi:TPR repeat protein
MLKIVIVLCSLFSASALAQQSTELSQAIAAFNRQDYAQALTGFEALARDGNAEAQYRLGFTYERGEGASPDHQLAASWYRKAADQGHARAQSALGSLYEFGQGVPRDFRQSVHWYRKAAEQGLSVALYNLGVMYRDGQGVLQDFIEAHKWFNLAAARSQYSDFSIIASSERNSLAEKMTREQIATAQARANAWRPENASEPKP